MKRFTLLLIVTVLIVGALNTSCLLASAEEFNNLGKEHIAKGHYYHDESEYDKANMEYDLAIADYTKAIELNPNDARPYYYRGSSYYQKGKYDLATADIEISIKISRDPDLTEIAKKLLEELK